MKYAVVFEPDEGGWHVWIPRVRGCRSWGRSLDAARRHIREALSTCVDVLGDAAASIARDAEFTERYKLPVDAKRALVLYQATKRRAEKEARVASESAQRAAMALTRKRISLRDAGELLGLSHERVHQIVTRHGDT